ncbi:MAG: DNA cytosine methyltransferase, partial [Pseudanabaena sp.]
MTQLRFIDLFAGIGGFRLGFTQAGYQCVFSCEIDPIDFIENKGNYSGWRFGKKG